MFPGAAFPADAAANRAGTCLATANWDGDMMAETYGTNYWDNDIARLQLNWSNSSPGLNLSTGGTWTWGSAVTGLIAPPPRITINDTDLSDGIVNIQNSAGITIAPASPFVVGVLAFSAPAYCHGAPKTSQRGALETQPL